MALFAHPHIILLRYALKCPGMPVNELRALVLTFSSEGMNSLTLGIAHYSRTKHENTNIIIYNSPSASPWDVTSKCHKLQHYRQAEQCCIASNKLDAIAISSGVLHTPRHTLVHQTH